MTATVAPASPDLAASIPDILRTGKRFVAWRSETRKGQTKPAKVPYSPVMDDPRAGASSTNPAHWTTFDKAQAYAEVAGLDGVMRAFHHDDDLVGVDLDHCRDPETGEIAAWARAIVKRLDSWTEVTPSGTGLHIIVLASLPPYGRKKGDVEMYGAEGGKTGPCGRFFTMTGARLEGTPDAVGYRPDALLAIHREVFGAAPDVTAAVRDPEHPVTALELADDEVIRLASTSAHNGARFLRLWDGDSSDYASGGNDGESEGDAALFEILGFYGGPDPERIERLARRSHRVREKWDRQADYLKRSITFALDGKTRFYGDSIQQPVTPAPIGTDGAEGCVCPSCPAVARVAFLEGRLLDRDDLLESQQAIIRAHQRVQGELREQLDGWKVILSNPNLKPADRIVAIPLVEHVLDARRNGQDEIHVRYPGIVNGWGIPESTVQKSAAILTEMDGAVLTKHNEPDKPIIVETKNGPREVTPWKTIVSATVDGDLYAAVGAYDPGLPQRGGKREALPQCPQHPDSDLIDRAVRQCAECRRPVEAARERTIRRQNEGVTAGEPQTPVDDRTYCPQNEGVTGHDGDEQSERASKVIPLPSRPRRERAEQPSWLEEWPDFAPPSSKRVYDDVYVSTVSGGSE